MNIFHLLYLLECRGAGADLDPHGRLRILAPAGALPAELRAALSQHRDDLAQAIRLSHEMADLRAHAWLAEEDGAEAAPLWQAASRAEGQLLELLDADAGLVGTYERTGASGPEEVA